VDCVETAGGKAGQVLETVAHRLYPRQRSQRRMQKRKLNEIINLVKAFQRMDFGKCYFNDLEATDEMRVLLRYCLQRK